MKIETIDVLLMLVTILINQLGLNSQNSSKPPSTDPNRKKKKKKAGDRKAGGQKGHAGTTLQKFDDPDHIEKIPVDRKSIPKGKYKDVGYESRQVVDIEISRIVTEYRAQILEVANGKRYTASFREGISRPVQYGLSVKVHSVYMSQYQLVPYKRIEEYFQDQVKIPISAGTVFNFNYDAYHKLEAFEAMVKSRLIESGVCHADETGININGKRVWLHCVSNDLWSYYRPHAKIEVYGNGCDRPPLFHQVENVRAFVTDQPLASSDAAAAQTLHIKIFDRSAIHKLLAYVLS